jgi:hypothetical protein
LDLKIIWSSGHIRPLHSRSWILIIQNCFIIPVNRPGGLSYNKHKTSTVVHVLAMYDTFFPEKHKRLGLTTKQGHELRNTRSY